MPNPTAGDVHVNKPLTNISLAYFQSQANFVADKVFPNLPVQNQSDVFYQYDRGHFNRDDMRIRAEGTESAGGGYDVDATPTYHCPVRAYHHDISDPRRANADSVLSLDTEATQLVTYKALIHREKNWVTKYFADSIWGTTIEGVASSPSGSQVLQWNDANSTPIENIRAGKTALLESTGFEPNTLVIGQRVFDALIDHPDIVDRVKYGQTPNGPAMVDTAELAALFKIPRVFIMKAIENTAAEGVTNVHSFIGGKSALLCYAAPTPGLYTPTAGYTFSWNGYLGATNQGFRIKRFRMENIASDRIEIEMAFDQKLIAADLGRFYKTIVA